MVGPDVTEPGGGGAGAPPRFGRRQLFVGALWTGATLASGGLLYRACFGSGPPGPNLLSLTEAEFLTARAAADAFFPAGEYRVSADRAGVAHFLDRYVHEMPRPKGRLFKLLLRSLEYSPALAIHSLTRFSRLSLPARQAVLADWEGSRVYAQRMGQRALLFACSSGYFECDEVLTDMGWGVGCVVSPRAPGELR